MRLLVDTCTFLWLAGNDRRLSAAARNACRNRSNTVYLSALSVWEIAIKHRLGRLPLPERASSFVINQRQALQLEQLAFDEACAIHESSLPAHHADPFDRGLVCQAIHHDLVIVTPDPAIASYPAPVLW